MKTAEQVIEDKRWREQEKMMNKSGRWVIRDDDKDNGRTFVRSWKYIKMNGVLSDAEARWTHDPAKAKIFTDRDVAKLVSIFVGGTARKAP